jgi:DHA3 family macrolide efflux protein-like MFS transporter
MIHSFRFLSLLEVNMKSWKKTVALFLVGQMISLFGSSLVQYALMWNVTLKTQSGTMMTIAILCGFLPMFFLTPFAGVWADRYPRKRLIILADGMIALATVLLMVLMLLGFSELWLIFTFMAVRALGSAVHGPAISAVLPQIVPQQNLTQVSGINGSVQSAVMLISPMVSAALLSFSSIPIILMIDVVTAIIAISMLLLFIPIPVHEKAQTQKAGGYFADLKAGFKYIGSHRYLMLFFLMCLGFMMMAAPVAFLTPLQVTRTFGGDYWRLTAIEVAFSAGMMAGGGLIAAWGGFRNRMHTMVMANIIIGLCTVALGFVPNFWVYLGFMVVTGLSMPVFNTPSSVLIQQRVDGDYLGRVFGVMTMIGSVGMPVGMLVFGPLADVIPIEWLLRGTGAAIAVIGLLPLLSRTMLAAGEPI